MSKSKTKEDKAPKTHNAKKDWRQTLDEENQAMVEEWLAKHNL